MHRLGCQIFVSEAPCPACYRERGLLAINHIRDVLYSTAVNANLGPTQEGRALIPGNHSKSADILIPHWVKGESATLDITVVNPLAQT